MRPTGSQAIEAYIPSRAKKGTRTSEGRKTIHRKMKKGQMFGKQMFSGPYRNKWDIERNFKRQTVYVCLPYLVHIMLWFLYDDSFLPGEGSLSNSFRQLGGKSKVLPELFVS